MYIVNCCCKFLVETIYIKYKLLYNEKHGIHNNHFIFAYEGVSIRMPFNERQREILYLTMQGLKMEAIAQELNISVNTVKYHKKKHFYYTESMLNY